MRALITGANGFVGRHLSAFLLDRGVEVIGLDQTLWQNCPYRQVQADINDRSALEQVLEGEQPDQIYHLAAPAFIPDSIDNPLNTFQNILFGTVNLLEIVRHRSPGSKLLYVGSSDEYGIFRGDPFREDMLPEPCTPYAAAKAAASMICGQYARMYNVNVIRTRSFNHMGPGQSPRFVSASMARQIAALEKSGGNKLQLGDIGTRRDFLDVRDVVNAYYMIMMKSGNAGELYNICSGRSLKIGDLLEDLLDLTDLRGRADLVIETIQKKRKYDNPDVCGSNEKIIKETGWRETYSYEQTIRDILNYWRAQV